MDEYFWNNRVEYLIKSRKTLWNTDYIQFLVEKVWNIHNPVNLVDFGCGMGFIGLLFLPILPKGSTYTGIDKGKILLDKAADLFNGSPYNVNFIEADLFEYQPEKIYDIATSHTVLQHIPNSIRVLEKMRDSVIPGGKVICIEANRIAGKTGLYFHGIDYDSLNILGIYQKLFLTDALRKGGGDGNGIKIPAYMQEIGLKDIGVRANDCVNFINSQGDNEKYKLEYDCFISAGWGNITRDKQNVVDSLVQRGLTSEEAGYLFDCEMILHTYVSENVESSCITQVSYQIISFGTV
jgi:SAM-dependent methyltransferase